MSGERQGYNLTAGKILTDPNGVVKDIVSPMTFIPDELRSNGTFDGHFKRTKDFSTKDADARILRDQSKLALLIKYMLLRTAGESERNDKDKYSLTDTMLAIEKNKWVMQPVQELDDIETCRYLFEELSDYGIPCDNCKDEDDLGKYKAVIWSKATGKPIPPSTITNEWMKLLIQDGKMTDRHFTLELVMSYIRRLSAIYPGAVDIIGNCLYKDEIIDDPTIITPVEAAVFMHANHACVVTCTENKD